MNALHMFRLSRITSLTLVNHAYQAGILFRTQSQQKQNNAGCSHSRDSGIGPKSGHQLRRPGLTTSFLHVVLWLSLVHVSTATATGLVDARVGAAPVTAPEATTAAKPNGMRKASESSKDTHVHRHVKRSYKRAYARSCREGGAHYKGKWHPMEWFAKTPLRTQSLRPLNSTQKHDPHWTVISWNAAGLTAETFQEIETYARTVRADILLLQETKWNFESTWASQEYLYVHTAGIGKHDRLAGLLTMISTRHVKADQLQHCIHHAGRLLHVRIPHGNTHVDVVNWYQYAVNQQEGTFERRQRLLIKLQKCIAHLPRRNSLVLGGDFNCPCERHANVCGSASLPPNPLHYTDYSDHQQVWRTLHLTALNTWTRPQHGQVATFVFEGTEQPIQSQIDFIMIRSHHCTQRSKKAGIIEAFPVAGWRTEAKHFPVRAEVPLPRPHWTPRPQTEKPVHIDQDKLINDLRQQLHCKLYETRFGIN